MLHSIRLVFKQRYVCVLAQEEDKPAIQLTGLCLVVVGIVLIVITNVLNDYERKRILKYLVRLSF